MSVKPAFAAMRASVFRDKKSWHLKKYPSNIQRIQSYAKYSIPTSFPKFSLSLKGNHFADIMSVAMKNNVYRIYVWSGVPATKDDCNDGNERPTKKMTTIHCRIDVALHQYIWLYGNTEVVVYTYSVHKKI